MLCGVLSGLEEYCYEILTDTKDISRKEWLEYRKMGIGGSDVPVIFGVSRFKTMRDIYFEKTGLKEYYDEAENWVQKEYGKILEPLVAKIFSAKTKFRIFKDTNMYRHRVHKFMNANIDYFIEMPDGSLGILECKTCSSYRTDDWKNNEIPFEHELQVRHYMAVMDIKKAYIACLYDNSESSLIIREVERDIYFEKIMIEREQNFWNEYILKKSEPPFIENGSLCIASVRKYENKNKNKDETKLSDEIFNIILKHNTLTDMKNKLRKQLKELDNEIKKCEADIILNMNEHEKCFIDYGNVKYSVINNISKRTSIDKDKLKHHYPDIYKIVANTSDTAKFSIKSERKSAF